ncbi:hypothetical protein F5Y13DRAFT_178784 [Hypoxylon sp. FL1857]|nr:hypothetical protein F5Y13DRAFT_178784 [Hypoxylon sp. FL1857]
MGPLLPFSRILATVPLQILWSWSNLFLFNLHNQRRAIAEDALSKPWRPLPSGRLSSQDATYVMYCMYPVTIMIALKCGGLVPCLLQSFCSLWYNEWGGDSDVVLKNLLNGIGIPCFLAGPLEVATGRAMAMTSHVQDFRDVDGDRAAGRKTLPLVIGSTNARLLVILGVGSFTCLSCWFWETGLRESIFVWLMGFILLGNLFFNRTRRADDLSWKILWFLWMLGVYLLPVFMFHK